MRIPLSWLGEFGRLDRLGGLDGRLDGRGRWPAPLESRRYLENRKVQPLSKAPFRVLGQVVVVDVTHGSQ